MTTPDLAAAERFLVSEARVLERRRLARHLHGGPAGPVRDAVAAYRNDDGGFGHALEPDSRTSASQPLATATALSVLHEADAWDPELAQGACDWLARVAPAAGGSAWVTPGIDDAPHAPWMAPPEPPTRGLPADPPALICTGLLAAVLHARGATHPWLTRATELLWERIATLADAERHPYELRAVLAFLAQVPDRAAAAAAAARVGALILERDLVTLDPEAPGETHGPLDYAPRPDAPARALFDDSVIAAHLDHLAAGQREDGGWTFDWLAWSPAAEREWRGVVTPEALLTLSAYGRLG